MEQNMYLWMMSSGFQKLLKGANKVPPCLPEASMREDLEKRWECGDRIRWAYIFCLLLVFPVSALLCTLQSEETTTKLSYYAY